MAKPLRASTILKGERKIINEKAYKPGMIANVVEIKVTLMLDPVPGAWHEPNDFMRWVSACRTSSRPSCSTCSSHSVRCQVSSDGRDEAQYRTTQPAQSDGLLVCCRYR